MIMGLINSLTQLCCGVGVIDIRDRAKQTKDFLIKSEERAKTRRLKEAIQLAKSGTRLWSLSPNFWEKLFRKWFLSDLLIKLEESSKKWSGQMQNAQRLIQEGNNLLTLVSDDPKEYENLEKALHCLQRAKNLLFDPKVNEQVKSYSDELQQRKHWLELFEDAQANALAKYFLRALPIYEEAQKFYSTDEINELIAICKSSVIAEKQYCQELKNAKSYCQQADFPKAFKAARMAITSFPREDGQKFLRSLERILESKTIFQKGLQHEQSRELDLALDCYTKAYKLMPDLLECRFRQIIVACKQENWEQALTFLDGLNGDRASYLRGFIFAKQQNYDDNAREWQGLRSSELNTQRSRLNIIKQKAYLLDLQAIEKFVDQGDLEKAANISHKALERHPQAEVIRKNLDTHILPRLDSEAWKQTEINWNVLLEKTRSIWLERPSLQSLHNWAVAAYYCAMNTEYPKLALIMEFNASWGTAIANLPDDPSLSNLPWLGNTKPDRTQLKQKLEELWDRVLDRFKGQDLNSYMQVRDWQRLDRYILNILTSSTKPIIKLGSIWILPSTIDFLQQFEKSNNNLTKSMLDLKHQHTLLPTPSQLSLLYSPLGIAIAACLDGDVERGLQLKNQNSGYLNHKEHFDNAQAMLCYFEACHLLKKNQWQEAFRAIRQSTRLIQKNPEWLSEIDYLCESMVRGLDEKEQIIFAKSWLETTASKAARNYYTECKTEEIRMQIANERIKPRQGLSKLRELNDIDKSNPVYRDLISRIEGSIAVEEIDQLLKRGEFEGAFNCAMRSGNREIKEMLVEIFLNILKECDRKGIQDPLGRMQIVEWIKRLVPDLVN
jgi:tetratricopeptide (TPR) repeat protein